MKRITIQFVVEQVFEVPDDTPTNGIDEFKKNLCTDFTSFCVGTRRSGYEIVDIKPLPHRFSPQEKTTNA